MKSKGRQIEEQKFAMERGWFTGKRGMTKAGIVAVVGNVIGVEVIIFTVS